MNDVRTLRDELLGLIDRWVRELDAFALRSTHGFGIAQKCCSRIDQILGICVEEWVRACGARGKEAAEKFGNWKSLPDLTLGQRVGLLTELNTSLPRMNRDLVPVPRAKIMAPQEIKVLEEMAKIRNRLAHNYVDVEPNDIKELFIRARVLCGSDLIKTVIALQQRALQKGRGGG